MNNDTNVSLTKSNFQNIKTMIIAKIAKKAKIRLNFIVFYTLQVGSLPA